MVHEGLRASPPAPTRWASSAAWTPPRAVSEALLEAAREVDGKEDMASVATISSRDA
jgi:chaperonin GroEL